MLRRLLNRRPDGWELRLWPTLVRLYYRRSPTTSGVEKRLGFYRYGRYEYLIEWWVSG